MAALACVTIALASAWDVRFPSPPLPLFLRLCAGHEFDDGLGHVLC